MLVSTSPYFFVLFLFFAISYSLVQILLFQEVLLLVSFIAPIDTSSLSVFLTQKNLCFPESLEHFISNFNKLVVTLMSVQLLLAV